MANKFGKLHYGAEFDSYNDFKQAFEEYCQQTKVKGEPVKFVHSSAQYIKNGSFPDGDEQQRLKFIMKSERCKFFGQTACDAAYKLELYSKPTGHVLRLEKFHGEHNSHIPFTPFNAELVPIPKKVEPSNNTSKDKLETIVKIIYNGIKNLPDSKCDAITAILENLWDRTEKDITYKVDFTDNPSENGKLIIICVFSLCCI